MRWYVSYPILAAGLALGFDVLFPDDPAFSRRAGAEIQAEALSAARVAPVVVVASDLDALPQASRIGQFSPGAKLLAAEVPSKPTSVLDYLAQTLTLPAAAPAATTPGPAPVKVAAWKGTIVRDGQSSSVTTARPEVPVSRLALTRDIQRELQRVGCYPGEIDGVWGSGSKRAVLIFMDRVNASLPMHEPDVFMLSLLKTQADAVCGASCPSGQSLTASGRCVPSTLVAQADKAGSSPQMPGHTWDATVAEASVASRGTIPFGRMSIGGPKPDDVAQLSSAWSGATGTTEIREPLERTAALDEAEIAGALPPAAAAAAAPSSFDTAIAPSTIKRGKSPGARAKADGRPQRTSTYRHVQRLFTHPLGM